MVLRKRQNLQAWAVFEAGIPVYRLDSKKLGILKELKITPGGMREVWVSWDGLLQIPDVPNLLQIDGFAMAQIIAKGDSIQVCNPYQLAGEIFTVERLLARGAIETTEEDIFEREQWTKVESFGEIEVDMSQKLSNKDDARLVTTPEIKMAEESVVAIETLAVPLEAGELTQDEEQERHRLELKVERAFYEAGAALRQLRDKRLYRSTHGTFEA